MLYLDDIDIGFTRTSDELELTENDIVEFARVWDPQPFHIDPDAARRSVFGGLTASACHVFCVASRLMHRIEPLAVVAGLRHELEVLEPTRPGDRLSMKVWCVERRASRSRPDRGIVRFDSELSRQDGTVVARIVATVLIARRPGA